MYCVRYRYCNVSTAIYVRISPEISVSFFTLTLLKTFQVLGSLSETELIKRLEVTGMASVAAARALETGLKAGLEKTRV